MFRIDGSGNALDHQTDRGNQGKFYGIFIGKIKDTVDTTGQGALRVWIAGLSAADENDRNGWFVVKYCSPFGGATSPRKEATGNSSTAHREANQSYGMWMVPPTLDVQVICGFINGNVKMGIWWAVLPQDGHTHSLPGVASGSTHNGKIRPVGERNRHNTADSQQQNRPEHPISHVIAGQGLENDLRRGHTNAGPFRARDRHPGLAYGILSPGQHSIMLDDGPDGISGGVRLRSARGHQILMHDEGKFIYIVNQNGSAWIELDEKGNIDFYAAGDFSVHAQKNINFHAGDNFNVQAANDINVNAVGSIKAEACEILNLTGTNGTRITSRLGFDILADGRLRATAQRIDLNGPEAVAANLPGVNSFVTNTGVGRSVASRVPEREPWGGHGRNSGGEPITTPTGRNDAALGNTNIEPIPESYNVPPESADAVNCIPRDELDKTVMSDTAFNMMKSREAYRGMMYSDNQGYSVGYGTRVDIFGPSNPNSRIDRNLQEALVRGPSESEARQASRQITDRHVTPDVRTRLKQQMEGKNVCITQAQFDALCMAAYGNPSQANNMTDQLVDAAAKSPDGRASNADVARIWANSRYSDDGNQRNAEAQYALTGNVPPGVRMKTPEQLAAEGQAADLRAVRDNRAQNPQYSSWRSELGNGPQTGTRVDPAFGAPSSMQRDQYERSYYLNNGQAPPGSRYTADQLSSRYGAPQTGGNIALIRSPTSIGLG